MGMVGIFIAAVLFAIAALVIPDASPGLYEDAGDKDGAMILIALGGLSAVFGVAQFILGIYRLVDGFDRAAARAHAETVDAS